MSRKIIIKICFSIISLVFVGKPGYCQSNQLCDIYMYLTNRFIPESEDNNNFLILNKYGNYINLQFPNYKRILKERLLGTFDTLQVDSILQTMESGIGNQNIINDLSICSSFNFINEQEYNFIFERNQTIHIDSLILMPRSSYNMFQFSQIIWIDGYAIVQITEVVSGNWYTTYVYLLIKTENNSWVIKQTLASSGA